MSKKQQTYEEWVKEWFVNIEENGAILTSVATTGSRKFGKKYLEERRTRNKLAKGNRFFIPNKNW